ncbi:MAG: hypothetical protein RSE91_03365 [Bacilli bacterium]
MFKNKAPHWSRLDNAAKIFPPVTTEKDPRVFRFSCELKEIIIKDFLQEAVEKVLLIFPYFTSTLKRGVFWYYLEQSKMIPLVQEETTICEKLYDRNKKSLLFRITYYQKKINFEVYHSLTDGNGALQFFRILIGTYLSLRHSELKDVMMDYDATQMEMIDDSFYKYYDKPLKLKSEKQHAWQFKGAKYSFNRMKITEGIISVTELNKIAKSNNTTITGLILAIYIRAMVNDSTIKDLKKPFIIGLPVNLRNHFKSNSARNFFGLIHIIYNYNENDSLEDIIKKVNDILTRELHKDKLVIRMNNMAHLEKNIFIRSIPLFIKDRILKIVTWFSKKEDTTSFSNLGIIKMPLQMIPYIDLFDVFNSTESLLGCMCSFEDKLIISFTSKFVSSNIQKNFFRELVSLSLKVTIRSNEVSDV